MFTLELDSSVYPVRFVLLALSDGFICRFDRHGVFTHKQFFVGVAVRVESLKEMFKRRENATSFQTTGHA